MSITLRVRRVLAGCLALGSAACAPDPLRRHELAAPAHDVVAAPPARFRLEPVGRLDGGGTTAPEIPAFDVGSDRLFVVNGALGTLDVVDLRAPGAPRRIATIGAERFGGGAANSVAAYDGIIAVAVQAADRTQPGTVFLLRAATLAPLAQVTVGALPDMLTFTPDGRRVVVANEGEPSDDYAVDPEGSISIIDVTDLTAPTVRTADFRAFVGQEASLRARGVHLTGPGATAAQDFEPEYIAVADDSRTAWATLQENNALAVIDLERAVVTAILPLGAKDHGRDGAGLDASDRDGGVHIRPWPVFGLFQPDAIAAYTVGGHTYLVTANEGDARAWGTFDELARVGTLALEPSVFTDAVCGGRCTDDERLGRLFVTTHRGRNAATGRHEALYTLGARSFSIWTADGTLVWDSGDAFERRTAALPNAPFNASSDNALLDERSDDRGPEPEGLVLGRVGGRTIAFIGLERVGGVMAYDVTDPAAPVFVTYVNTRQGAAGDRGPEGLVFIPAERSPDGRALLVVGFEVSGSTVVFALVPE